MLAKKTMGKSGLVWLLESRMKVERAWTPSHTDDDSCLPAVLILHQSESWRRDSGELK